MPQLAWQAAAAAASQAIDEYGTAEFSSQYEYSTSTSHTYSTHMYSPYAHTGNLRSHICLNFRPHRESAVYFRLKGRYEYSAQLYSCLYAVYSRDPYCSAVQPVLLQKDCLSQQPRARGRMRPPRGLTLALGTPPCCCSSPLGGSEHGSWAQTAGPQNAPRTKRGARKPSHRASFTCSGAATTAIVLDLGCVLSLHAEAGQLRLSNPRQPASGSVVHLGEGCDGGGAIDSWLVRSQADRTSMQAVFSLQSVDSGSSQAARREAIINESRVRVPRAMSCESWLDHFLSS
eukprot:SAG25_NODE_46_length_19040_cov_20.665699_1_plen_288_part_00